MTPERLRELKEEGQKAFDASETKDAVIAFMAPLAVTHATFSDHQRKQKS